MSFADLLDLHIRAGGCDCLDHLRLVGLTPPKRRLGEFQVSKAFPPGEGPRGRGRR
jgi:hypothetical protein